jgi:glycolate oxidase
MSTAFEAMGARLAEDVCVPIARLAEFVRGVQAVADRHSVLIPVSGHGGDGNLHPSIVYPRDDPGAAARAWAAFDDVIRLGLSVGGTITGEHGIGSVKVPWLALELGDAEVTRQRRLKAVFDPLGIMNPGKVFASSPPSDPR